MTQFVKFCVLSIALLSGKAWGQELATSAESVLLYSCGEGESIALFQRQADGGVRLTLTPITGLAGDQEGLRVLPDGWQTEDGAFFFRTGNGFLRFSASEIFEVRADTERRVPCFRKDNERIFEIAWAATQTSLRESLSEADERLANMNAERLAEQAALEEMRRKLEAAQTQLSEAEKARLAEEAAAMALRERLSATQTDLSDAEAERLSEAAAAEKLREQLAGLETSLSEEETARLAEAAAAEALRKRLQDADAELTAMTLALEEKRKEAEDTLTLLAAAKQAEDDLTDRLMGALAAKDEAEAALDRVRSEMTAFQTIDETSEDALRKQLAIALADKVVLERTIAEMLNDLERKNLLLTTANEKIEETNAATAEDQRRLVALNAQVEQLRRQMGSLQAMLNVAAEDDKTSEVQIQALGQQLNAALARAAQQEKLRVEAEKALAVCKRD